MWAVRSELEVNVAEQARQRQVCLVFEGVCGEVWEVKDAVEVGEDVGGGGGGWRTGEIEVVGVGMLSMDTPEELW